MELITKEISLDNKSHFCLAPGSMVNNEPLEFDNIAALENGYRDGFSSGAGSERGDIVLDEIATAIVGDVNRRLTKDLTVEAIHEALKPLAKTDFISAYELIKSKLEESGYDGSDNEDGFKSGLEVVDVFHSYAIGYVLGKTDQKKADDLIKAKTTPRRWTRRKHL